MEPIASTETARANDAPAALDLAGDELARRVVEAGGRPFHARSIRDAILRRGVFDFAAMTDLPRATAARLTGNLRPLSSRILERRESPDGTAKLLVGLRDGNAIETVVLPGRAGATLCVSTQVGCPVGCLFCASGLEGVVRNLRASEIVEQFLLGREEAARRLLRNARPVARAVIMGIGEPTLNLDALLEALAVVGDPSGFGLGARRITISSVGYPDRIRRLAKAGKAYGLAVSLHAPDDPLRRRLVPTMANVKLRDIVAAAADYFRETGREVTFEYVLLGGVNDSIAQARALADLLSKARATVNLIPYNPVAQTPYRRPLPGVPAVFARALRARGIPATVRWSKGLEAEAACGQLRIARRARARA